METAEIERIIYRNRVETEHRKLDTEVRLLENTFPVDNNKIKTLKKKKLRLKDLLLKLKLNA
tara:strand:+ start:2019 stop:2204 length:186 start_codon:yes stop_codon:yes gene_type:complete